jgi:predicted Zn finger-like uncharacterized protein
MKNIRRTTCENCGAPYAIDVGQLRREENRVTCRRCKHKMIIYKSTRVDEPDNEQALIVNDDEKTHVDDSPKIQIDEMPFETAVSKAPPPFSRKSKIPIGNRSKVEEVYNLQDELSNPPIAKHSSEATGNISTIPKHPNPNKIHLPKKSNQNTTQLQDELQMCAALIVLGILGIFGQVYFQDSITPLTISILLSIASLVFAFSTLITSGFGIKPTKALISASVSAVVTGVIASVLFLNPSLLQSKQVSNDITSRSTSTEANIKIHSTKNTEQTDVQKGETKDPKEQGDNDIDTQKEKEKDKKKDKDKDKDSKKDSSEDDNKKSKLDEQKEEKITPEEKPKDEELPGPDELNLDEPSNNDSNKEKEEKSQPAATSIPFKVIEIIIVNNKSVKRCYLSHRQKTGDLPKNIEVLFTVQPSGRVSQAYIAQGPYVGSSFESCIRSAFKSMSFPEFDKNAKPQSLRYKLRI